MGGEESVRDEELREGGLERGKEEEIVQRQAGNFVYD